MLVVINFYFVCGCSYLRIVINVNIKQWQYPQPIPGSFRMIIC
jgi:hypothetical protein